MNLTTAVLAAVIGGLTLGPLVLHLAHWTCHTTSRFGPPTTVAVLPITGVATLHAVAHEWDAVTLPIVVLGTAAAVVDVHERRLPNVLTGTLTALTAVAIIVTSLEGGKVENGTRAVLAALITTVVAVGLKAALPAGMGWGDVKLLPALAAALAWHDLATLYRGVLAWMLLLLLTVSAWPLLRAEREETVPYGPALVAGALGVLVVA